MKYTHVLENGSVVSSDTKEDLEEYLKEPVTSNIADQPVEVKKGKKVKNKTLEERLIAVGTKAILFDVEGPWWSLDNDLGIYLGETIEECLSKAEGV